jgi:hypothetical protein
LVAAPLEQELDHPSASLFQLGLFAAEPGPNGGGQRRVVEFEAAGVDVGAGIQKDGGDGVPHGVVCLL